jgi:hypothetical protein
MIITDFAHLDKPITVQLKQKGVRMTRAGEAKEMSKGWRIYGVGYGFNAMTNEIARNPICMMDSMSQDGLLTKDAIKLEFQERHYTGSCYSELTNNLKAEAKFSGEYSGFKGEVSYPATTVVYWYGPTEPSEMSGSTIQLRPTSAWFSPSIARTNHPPHTLT